LRDLIEHKGMIGDCNACGTHNVRLVELSEIEKEIIEFVYKYWGDLKFEITYNNRFFKMNHFENFIQPAILRSSKKIPKDTILYRTRIYH